MVVKLSNTAELELEEIGGFIAEDSPSRASSFLLELLERCNGLAEYPERYPVAIVVDGVELRRCPHGRYLIFYAVDAGSVVIAHILHSSRNYLSILYPGG